MPDASNLVPDGDAAFIRVDNRRPAHALEPGCVASATNQRFEQGEVWPRFGIDTPAWGRAVVNLCASLTWDTDEDGVQVDGFTVGRTYRYVAGNSRFLTTGFTGSQEFPAGTEITAGTFIATQTTYYLWWTSAGISAGLPVSALIYLDAKTCGYGRFDNPLESDSAILLTDGLRDGAGEDGGRGRAWRIIANNAPLEIPMNGHDIWGTARLIQCQNGMVMLRQGNERHYFAAAAVDGAADTIQLNCEPNWTDGDAVLFHAEADSYFLGTSAPAPDTIYYVKAGATNKVELYADTGLTIKLDFASASGHFYLERQATAPGFFGNGAPPLIMQPNATGSTAFEVGFLAVDTTLQVTDTVGATDVLTVPNHRLLPGDQVTGTLSTTGAVTAKYVAPLSDHQIVLYATLAEALARVASGTVGTPFNVSNDAETGTLTKSGASGLAMPPGSEGIFYKERLIVINGKNIVIGDIGDPLHYTVFSSTIPANLGESGGATWLLPLGEDALLIAKRNVVLVLTGLSGDSTNWAMDDITREYGGIAPLAAVSVGTDAWFLSRKGMASVVRTAQGQKLGVARTISEDIPKYLAEIDWRAAVNACAATWNNRLFLAVPVKGQDDPARNNAVLVYNFLNQSLRVQQQEVNGEIIGSIVDDQSAQTAWEGKWTGDWLEPYAFARLTIAGEERLTFATPDGIVCWFTDGWEDAEGMQISTELETRGYFGGARALALKGGINWDTNNPTVTVIARVAGYNEEQRLVDALTKDNTKYTVYGQADYDSSTATETDFDLPHREDYSLTAEELLIGTLDVHQNSTQPLRMRVRDRAVRLVIRNAQGSVRIKSATVNARLIGRPIGVTT